MQGNWNGRYKGSNSGQLIVELDDRDHYFQGCAYAYDAIGHSRLMTMSTLPDIKRHAVEPVRLQVAES